jgi:hypothetical protein
MYSEITGKHTITDIMYRTELELSFEEAEIKHNKPRHQTIPMRHLNISTNINKWKMVFTSVTMKNAVFGDVTPCGSCKNRHFGGSVLRMLVMFPARLFLSP